MGFFRSSDYGVSSDVWWKKGGTWEPRRRHVWREYFWQTVWGILFLSITRLITYFPVAYPDPLRCDMIPLSIRPPKLPIIDFIINIGRAADPPSPSQENTLSGTSSKIPSHVPQHIIPNRRHRHPPTLSSFLSLSTSCSLLPSLPPY